MSDQSVRTEVTVFGKNVVLSLSTAGVGTVPITLDPQAASQMAEHLARAAFEAFHGNPARTDISHVHAQVQAKVTAQMESLLRKRLEVMLNSLREDRTKSNAWLATELLHTVLTKVA